MATCIESFQCPPHNPIEVFKLFDIQYMEGMTVVMMALVLGGITLSIYLKNRSLPMLAVLGIYEIAGFGSILLSKYLTAQYQIAEYVIIMGAASGLVMLVLRLVKE